MGAPLFGRSSPYADDASLRWHDGIFGGFLAVFADLIFFTLA